MKKKKIVFYEHDHRYAEFKIRLEYDRIRQGDFYRFILERYINNDADMLSLVEKYKIENCVMGKKRLNQVRGDFEASRRLLTDLGITSDDREEIFDMIEEDT